MSVDKTQAPYVSLEVRQTGSIALRIKMDPLSSRILDYTESFLT